MKIQYFRVYDHRAIDQLQGVRIPDHMEVPDEFDIANIFGPDWAAEQVQVMQ
jgi:hypothetical protein